MRKLRWLKLEGEENISRQFTPHMEYHFDEITENKSFICPIIGKNVAAELTRRAYIYKETPFVDVLYCSVFGDRTPTCKKECLRLLNYGKYFQK